MSRFNSDLAYRIIEILRTHPPWTIWFRRLHELCGGKTLRLKIELGKLEKKGYVDHKSGERKRVYYAVMHRGERWFLRERRRKEEEEKPIKRLASQYPGMSNEEWKDLLDDMKDQFEYWCDRLTQFENRITKLEDLHSNPPRTGAFHAKFPMKTARYEGYITIHSVLTLQEMDRREKELQEVLRNLGIKLKIPILKEGEPMEDGSAPLIEIGYRTPDGKVVLFEEQPKELVESLKAKKVGKSK